MPCEHDLADKEGACADGMCPICIAAEIEQLRSEMGRAVAAEIEQLQADLDLRNQTALDRKEIIARLEAEIERLRATCIERDAEIERAVAAERERWAKLVNEWPRADWQSPKDIAAAIRNGE